MADVTPDQFDEFDFVNGIGNSELSLAGWGTSQAASVKIDASFFHTTNMGETAQVDMSGTGQFLPLGNLSQTSVVRLTGDTTFSNVSPSSGTNKYSPFWVRINKNGFNLTFSSGGSIVFIVPTVAGNNTSTSIVSCRVSWLGELKSKDVYLIEQFAMD